MPTLVATINGTTRTTAIRVESLSITDHLDGTPNTATLRVDGFTPTHGQEIKIGLDGLAAAQLVFAGHILTATQVYEAQKPVHIAWDLSCISYEWLLNRRMVTVRYQSTSATTIVAAIISGYTSGFTTTNVESGLDVLDEITFTNESVTACLDRIGKRIGASWYVDYAKDVHMYTTSEGSVTITTAAPQTMRGIAMTTDLSQTRTRAMVEGGGAPASAQVPVGCTKLPVADLSWYDVAGGTVKAGPQHLTYTGVAEGQAGAQMGTNLTPTNGPAVALSVVAGLSVGVYGWKITFVTASGETLPGPASVDTTGASIPAPSSAPSVARASGGVLGTGDYRWKVTYVDSQGNETTPSSASSVLTMGDEASTPGSIGAAAQATSASFPSGLDTNANYAYKITFFRSSDLAETLPSPASNTFTTGATALEAHGTLYKSGTSSPPAGFVRRFYRTVGGGGSYFLLGLEGVFWYADATLWADDVADASLGAAAPSASTASFHKASLTNIPVSPDPNVVSRRIYRTAVGGSTYKLVTTIANNTATTYTDNTADGSLGANAPSSNTTAYGSANLSSIAIGPSGTTSRKLYRTIANGSTYKLLTTIANNTTTTFTDTTADGSLGANAPSSDTSGLVIETGTIAAGATSMAVTAIAPFSSTGGWAFVGSLPFLYGGISGMTLTGIPAAGVAGALTTSARYGTVVGAAPVLTGIPASGVGSILYEIPSGEDVNVLITRNNTSAQTALAALVGGDGIHEVWLQDRRLSIAECENLGDAKLLEVGLPIVSVRYDTQHSATRSGLNAVITLTAPTSISGTFKIQSVTRTAFDPKGVYWPTCHVEASSRLFSFEAFLRLIQRVR